MPLTLLVALTKRHYLSLWDTDCLPPGRKEGRFTHPWQPARLIGWNNVWVGQCDISAMTSCQGRL